MQLSTLQTIWITIIWSLSTSVATGQPLADSAEEIIARTPAPTHRLSVDTVAQRPRIGLVLSGGGARGLAHVGVLKLLERERIPVDVIVGTSMGAIIGGLYASGLSAQTLETELLKVRWESVFAGRIDRQELSQRRKEEDFEISPLIEIGMRDGELRVPLGAVSGRGLENLLRRYTLPVSQVKHFDALPIPFRAIATDMESGQVVVLAEGDLALAMRSSMSVPGIFAPTERDNRILGDGGLVDNLPVDIARALGADIIIAVNIGTPLAPRHTLNTVGGLTTQMVNILTEQNVQRSLAQLRTGDVLISPNLGSITSADFNKTADLMALGEQGALLAQPQLAALSLSPALYTQWQQSRASPPRLEGKITAIAFEGSTGTRPNRLLPQMESAPGRDFDAARAERDTRRLAGSGDYERTDYTIRSSSQGNTLVFDLEDKPWGPHYFRVGLDMSTDFTGNSAFNLKLSHNRHWLDDNGSEWRNRVQIGEVPLWFTEIYRPLDWALAGSRDWFVAGWNQLERRTWNRYDQHSSELLGRYNRRSQRLGIDLGQPWGQFGEIRLGLTHGISRDRPELVALSTEVPSSTYTIRETGGRLRITVDQLDFANFPQRGYRLNTELWAGRQRSSLSPGQGQDVKRFELEGSLVNSWGAHTLNGYARLQTTDNAPAGTQGLYRLGGFHQLSGYKPGQIEGNAVILGRLTYYQRLNDAPVLTRGFFVGGSLEAGNGWASGRAIRLGEMRGGGSAFLGADTAIGPLYLGLTYASRGSLGVYLFIGRP